MIFKCDIFGFGVQFLVNLYRVYMKMCAWMRPYVYSYTYYGARMKCDSRDFIQRRIRHFGIFEHNLTFFTSKILRESDVYIDIGANIGYFTLIASKFVGPVGRVVAVEADPNTFRQLMENLRLNSCSNVQALNVAATGEVCKVRIERANENNSGKNSIAMDSEGVVDGWPFDQIVGDNFNDISFIKIDIEGAEAPILDAILARSKHMSDELIVVVETSPSSSRFIEEFLASDFNVYKLSNIYDIDYYLIRQYARKFGVFDRVELERVDRYDPRHSDYVLVRGSQNILKLEALRKS